jgi:hypothetical protein
MSRGKKAVAQKVVYDCFDIIKDRSKQDPRHVFNKALKMVTPLLEVRGRRVGGANYQIPYQVRVDLFVCIRSCPGFVDDCYLSAVRDRLNLSFPCYVCFGSWR